MRVVVLDVSQSMAARDRGRRADRAGADRGRQLSPLSAGAGGQPDPGRRAAAGVFDGPSTNFDALRDELARCRALPRADGRESGAGPGGPDAGADLGERSSAAGIGRGERFPAIDLGEGRFLAAAGRYANPIRIDRPGRAAGESGDSAGRGPHGRLAGQHATRGRGGQLLAHRPQDHRRSGRWAIRAGG